MSQRPSDRHRQAGAPRRGAARAAASGARTALINVARVILLVILAAATIWAFFVLVGQPAQLGPKPTVESYVGCALACVAACLMLALALNGSYLGDRLFPPRRLQLLFSAVSVTGAAAIIVGLLGSFRLGTEIALVILAAVVPFVLMGLVSPGLYRRPGNATPAQRDDAAASAAERERARQRRGGRGKR
jgi:hypothetical protein